MKHYHEIPASPSGGLRRTPCDGVHQSGHGHWLVCLTGEAGIEMVGGSRPCQPIEKKIFGSEEDARSARSEWLGRK